MAWVNQSLLVKQLRSIFPDAQTHVNTRHQLELKNPSTGSSFEFDVWIPQHNVCFEFQDTYHYIPTWYSQITRAKIQGKDKDVKQVLSKQIGVTLVVVPCWWDGAMDREGDVRTMPRVTHIYCSLLATIHFQRPDLIRSTSTNPISFNSPVDFFQFTEIPDVGELMLASFPPDKFAFAPNSWWIGEKYDGIRCCWHPKQHMLSGRELPLLQEVDAMLPKIILDGELWFGRGLYSHSYMLFKGSVEQVQWQQMRLVGFDAPLREIHSKSFERRYKYLLTSIPSYHALVIVAPRVLYKNKRHLNFLVQSIIDDGGEGAILRRVRSKYEFGRSSSLFKLKHSIGDREAIVSGFTDEEPKIKLTLPNGVSFHVSTPDISPPLAVGDVVTFSYENYSRREVPLNPKIQRVRSDLSWEEVLQNEAQETLHRANTHEFTARPPGYWASEKNMRALFEDVIKLRNEDPLLPETWYNLSSADMRQVKSGGTVISKFSSYSQAVQSLFPEVKVDESELSQGSWIDVDSRRKFFEKYARDNGFDPRNPDNWYAQPPDLIMSVKSALSVVRYHKNLAQALIDLFPEIGFDKRKLGQQYLWNDPRNRRKFFENYAKSNEFDPLNPNNWHSHPKEKILVVKGAYNIIYYHKNSVTQALLDLFPDIGLSQSKFITQLACSARDNRRQFFVNYARENGFNPLKPENWYSHPLDKIMSVKGIAKIIYYHMDSVAKALIDLFPDVGFDKSNFAIQTAWHDSDNRRKFFQNYAKSHGFNPLIPTNWYLQPIERIIAVKGAFGVVSYHKGSVIRALLDLFPNIGLDRTRFTAESTWVDRRRIFENYADVHGFDPLNPENWYLQPKERILSFKGIQRVIKHHNYSVARALVELFPKIGLEKTKFWVQSLSNSLGVWRDESNRRKFLEKYANVHTFDPNVAENWYSQSKKQILAFEGASHVVYHHRNSVSQALLDLFPDIGLDKSKLFESEWHDPESRKQFFENYAKECELDPNNPNEWYSQPMKKVLSMKGATNVAYYHKGSIAQALMDLFPNIGLEKSKLWDKALWYDRSYRRKYLEHVAKTHGFDPLVATNWYSFPREKFIQVKGIFENVLSHHNKSVTQAVLDLFPDIGLDKSKFWDSFRWRSVDNRRKFFEEYAKTNSFDPRDPHQWHSQSIDKILSFKEIAKILYYHNNSVAKALFDLFPDIGIDTTAFSRPSWHQAQKRKKFFEDHARARQFDPNVAENWYNQDLDEIAKSPWATVITSYHKGLVAQALLDLFPNIGLKKNRLAPSWDTEEARRKFFEKYAKSNNFDPLLAENWYSQARYKIMHVKGASNVMLRHGNSVAKALVDLFPQVMIDPAKMRARCMFLLFSSYPLLSILPSTPVPRS